MATMNLTNNSFFAKTERGREEIATRKYGLASRLRWLLVLVDGKTSKAELLQKVSSLGLDDNSISELVNSDFIEQIDSEQDVAADSAPSLAQNDVPPPKADAMIPPAPLATAPAEETRTVNDVEQILAVKEFFNQTIKSTLGLRGFALQLKVERASTLQDLIELRKDYLEAILKAKGKEIAYSLAARLEQHLGMTGKSPDLPA
ncbi:MAG TPA: hypothetical protein VGE12_04470 [Noviherbaspirillum sp.]